MTPRPYAGRYRAGNMIKAAVAYALVVAGVCVVLALGIQALDRQAAGAAVGQLAADDRGSAAAEYAFLFAGLVLAGVVMLTGTAEALDLLWHGIAEPALADTAAPTLCAGPVRSSPTGGSC